MLYIVCPLLWRYNIGFFPRVCSRYQRRYQGSPCLMLTSGFLRVRYGMACSWTFWTYLSCLVHRIADEYGFTPRLSDNFSKIYHVKFILKILFQLEEFGSPMIKRSFTYWQEAAVYLEVLASWIMFQTIKGFIHHTNQVLLSWSYMSGDWAM